MLTQVGPVAFRHLEHGIHHHQNIPIPLQGRNAASHGAGDLVEVGVEIQVAVATIPGDVPVTVVQIEADLHPGGQTLAEWLGGILLVRQPFESIGHEFEIVGHEES